jgi:hypothetical protein
MCISYTHIPLRHESHEYNNWSRSTWAHLGAPTHCSLYNYEIIGRVNELRVKWNMTKPIINNYTCSSILSQRAHLCNCVVANHAGMLFSCTLFHVSLCTVMHRNTLHSKNIYTVCKPPQPQNDSLHSAHECMHITCPPVSMYIVHVHYCRDSDVWDISWWSS